MKIYKPYITDIFKTFYHIPTYYLNVVSVEDLFYTDTMDMFYTTSEMGFRLL